MGYGKNPPSTQSAAAKKRKNARVPYTDFRFARIELSEEHKEQLRSLVTSGEFESLSPDFFLEQGYSLGYSVDDDGRTVICTASMYNVEHPNAGLRLTGRGRDATAALCALTFKHVYLCTDGLWREGESRLGGSYSDYG